MKINQAILQSTDDNHKVLLFTSLSYKSMSHLIAKSSYLE